MGAEGFCVCSRLLSPSGAGLWASTCSTISVGTERVAPFLSLCTAQSETSTCLPWYWQCKLSSSSVRAAAWPCYPYPSVTRVQKASGAL